MKDKEALERFVYQALDKGRSREEVQETLAQAGWAEADIKDALADWSEVVFPIPVPSSRRSHSPFEAFLYLLLYLSLGLVLFHTGYLMLHLIDGWFPESQTLHAERLRWPIAIVLVNLPIFLTVHRILGRRFRHNPALAGSATRKWFTYLALAIAAAFVTGDVATLIYKLLGGEVSIRFMLKALTVAVLAGGAFLYYLREMRQVEQEP